MTDTTVTPRAKRREAVDGRLVEALLGGASWRDAAALAGCSHATVARRMRDPEFRGLLTALRRDALRRVTDTLIDGATEAVQCLRDVMGDPEAAASARVSAAAQVLGHAARYVDVHDLAERVDHLEAIAAPQLRLLRQDDL